MASKKGKKMPKTDVILIIRLARLKKSHIPRSSIKPSFVNHVLAVGT